jgi:sugar/nucleoside kinase (ribokinase family)
VNPEIVVAGGVRLDYVIDTAGEAHLRQIGGNAVYAAAGARLWTERVGLLSRVGENFPPEVLRLLNESGFDMEGVHVIPGKHETATFYAYMPDGRRLDTAPAEHFRRIRQPLPHELAYYEHSTPGQGKLDPHPLGLIPQDVPPSYEQAPVFHIAPCQLRTHIDLPPVLKERGLPLLCLDPGERDMLPALAPHILGLLRNVDVYLPSEQEVQSLLGEDIGMEEAARRFAAAGPAIVCLKLGRQGALLYERRHDRFRHIPCFLTQTVDVTGAGDSFCGGFAVGYQQTGDPLRAAYMGAVSASLVIEGYGALHALGKEKEAVRRLHRLESLI